MLPVHEGDPFSSRVSVLINVANHFRQNYSFISLKDYERLFWFMFEKYAKWKLMVQYNKASSNFIFKFRREIVTNHS